ncbi:G-type lectin S-receptor-like serine/threonine-protein kinase At2g19130 [Aristolochia californica]|uniref:G-type lectin S-receptor-like serine/threonine-protein kinase At2g19130 n=1 Tax=Aristolochia californica TaxID=171875 RepID=UPI0035E169EB
MDAKTRPLLSLPFLLLFFSSGNYISLADTISSGESLTGTRILTSKGGNFELGFFRSYPSPKYYLGIWYKKISEGTVVWVANRETPVSDESSEVRIAEDGNLIILDQSKVPVWSTNSSSTRANSAIVELLDSGNLVLRDKSNSTAVFWQSFDHPTDTLLPGGRLRFSEDTGFLFSWRNSEDPAPGPFSLRLDSYVTAQYSILWNGTRTYSTSGVWNGQIIELFPEMRSNSINNFSLETTDKGNYFTYFVYNSSIITRFVMDFTGQMKQLEWLESKQQWDLVWSQPRAQCDVYSLCGPFSICNENGRPPCSCLQGFEPRFAKEWNLGHWSVGCIRKRPLSCGKEDAFRLLTGMRSPANGRPSSAKSREECESDCRSDCSCSAFSFLVGCFIWKVDLVNLQYLSDGDPRAVNICLRLAASDVSKSGNRSSRALLVGVTVGPLAGIIAFLGIVYMVHYRSRRRQRVNPFASGPDTLLPFSYMDLQTITKNFSEKLGGGGFGSVFKGSLPDSTVVAVKKLEGLGQGEKQFRAEVSTIGTIQHLNLARLRGFCSERSHRLLVYDYMSKGSLDSHLFGKNSEVLRWETRYQIALGTARGLAYLHENCRDCIIHCDIKPENVLLDASFCPKVADFGLAKLVNREFSRVMTTMRGTPGYLAPEWISGVAITPKADVYSYGMLLFEIISGRKNFHQIGDVEFRFFPILAAKKINKGEILSLLDCRLQGEADMMELSRVCRVACWCIQDEEHDRPSMGQVVKILEGLVEVTTLPVPRFLQVLAVNLDHNSTITDSESSIIQNSETQ